MTLLRMRQEPVLRRASRIDRVDNKNEKGNKQ